MRKEGNKKQQLPFSFLRSVSFRETRSPFSFFPSHSCLVLFTSHNSNYSNTRKRGLRTKDKRKISLLPSTTQKITSRPTAALTNSAVSASSWISVSEHTRAETKKRLFAEQRSVSPSFRIRSRHIRRKTQKHANTAHISKYPPLYISKTGKHRRRQIGIA